MGLGGQFGGVAGLGDDGQHYRCGQGQHLAIPRRILAEVVDDDGQVRGSRLGESAGQGERPGQQPVSTPHGV